MTWPLDAVNPNSEGIDPNMAEYGEGSSEHAYRAEVDATAQADTEQRLVEFEELLGPPDPGAFGARRNLSDSFPSAVPDRPEVAAAAAAAREDAVRAEKTEEGATDGEQAATPMSIAVRLTNVIAGGLWTPTGRQPNEWESVGGARLRLSGSNGEVVAVLLPKGWREMATWQRAATAVRRRLHTGSSEAAWHEFGWLLGEYGAYGEAAGAAEREATGGATEDLAGAVAAPAGVAGAAVLPEPGRSALKVAPTTVDLGPVGGRDSGMLPARAHATDAGLDLYTVGTHTIPAGEWADIPCGIAVEIPDHLWGMIIGRSSTLRKKSLMVQISVIDPGYRGPLFVQAWNLGREGARVADKERIGQLILVPNITPMFEPTWTEALGRSERGVDGFGSSGR